MDNVSPFTIGEAQFQVCHLAQQFIENRVHPRVMNAFEAAPSDDGAMFAAAMFRTVAWGRTLGRLNEAGDFQAVTAASRALFEIAVDVTLMYFAPGLFPPSRLRAWEDSAKLKAALKIREYLKGPGVASTNAYDAQMLYITTHEARVQALRRTHWNGKHPRDRWTGQDRNLEKDAKAGADYFAGGFVEFYATRYQQACWYTHGAGAVGVRQLHAEYLPALSVLPFGDCTKFALVSAEVIARQFALWDEQLAVEFSDHRKHRIVLAHQIMSAGGSTRQGNT